MKIVMIGIVCMTLSCGLFAQGRGGQSRGGQGGQGQQRQPNLPGARQPAAPLPTRQVSGIVKDSTDQSVIGATVSLVSKNDTLKVSTNADGIFVFKSVKAPEFTLSVKSLGMAEYVKKYFYTYTAARLVLDPITLKADNKMLDVVKIDGTPAITYKTDTVEYKAADYKVRENATMEDLLKKMDGIEVDKDGNVSHQGIAVTRARINGQNYGGNNLAGVIRDLPAEIAEKIQVIDDYGDEAEITGVKTGDPQKVLNIVTSRDKSVMNRGNFAASKGTTGRASGDVSLNRLNGNQQINIHPNGVMSVIGAGGGGNFGGGGGGTGARKNGTLSTTYNDRFSKKVRMEAQYSFGLGKSDQETNTVSTETYPNIPTTVSSTRSTGQGNRNYSHEASARFQISPDVASRLIISPSFSWTTSSGTNATSRIQTGGINQNTTGKTSNSSSAPNFGISASYNRAFGESRKTSLGVNVNASRRNTGTDNTIFNHILYYDDFAPFALYKDSLVNRVRLGDNQNNNYRTSITFTHRMANAFQLELNAQINYRGTNTDQTTSNYDPATGQQIVVDSISKIYNYSFTEKRVTLNLRRGNNATKLNYSFGIAGVPGLLKGESESLGNTTRRESFNIVPVVRIEYKWNRQRTLSINYNGSPAEPQYAQIQDVPDVSTPGTTIYGNPNLKTSFRHNVTASFNSYFVASRISMNASSTYTSTANQVVQNSIQNTDKLRTRETRYFNREHGNTQLNNQWGLNKSTANQVFRFRLNGNITNSNGISRQNGLDNKQTSWSFNERFNVQIEPKEWLQINPNISHTFRKQNYSLPRSLDSRTKNWDLGIDGRIIVKNSLIIGYDIGKNFVSGMNPNMSLNNPLIITPYLRQEFLKRKNLTMEVRGYDLLNQNNGANTSISALGTSVTQNNSNSRFFNFSLNWRPSRYSSSRRTQGPRAGDGSFIIR